MPQLLIDLLQVYLWGVLGMTIINMIILWNDRHDIFGWSFISAKHKRIVVISSLIASVKFSLMWFYYIPMWMLGKTLTWFARRRMRKHYDNFKT